MAISLKTLNDTVEKLKLGGNIQAISIAGKCASNLLCGTTPAVTSTNSSMTSSSGKLTLPAGVYLFMLNFYIYRHGQSYGSAIFQIKNATGSILVDFGSYAQDHYGYGGTSCVKILTLSTTTTVQPSVSISGVIFPSINYFTALKLYYNFSYNIIYKIYTKYKFHKIAISLSHFLNFITGGETWKWL